MAARHRAAGLCEKMNYPRQGSAAGSREVVDRKNLIGSGLSRVLADRISVLPARKSRWIRFSERNIVHRLFRVGRSLAAGLGGPRVAIPRSLPAVRRVGLGGRELVSSHGFFLKSLGRLLEMAHDQAQKMKPRTLRFKELMKLETSFKEGLLLIKDILRQTLDQLIVASLKDVHRGTVLVDGQVTHRGCKLPG